MLSGTTGLTSLRFTFAQSFHVLPAMVLALARLTWLEVLHMNSFDMLGLAENGLHPLISLTKLRVLELSGLARVHTR